MGGLLYDVVFSSRASCRRARAFVKDTHYDPDYMYEEGEEEEVELGEQTALMLGESAGSFRRTRPLRPAASTDSLPDSRVTISSDRQTLSRLEERLSTV